MNRYSLLRALFAASTGRGRPMTKGAKDLLFWVGFVILAVYMLSPK